MRFKVCQVTIFVSIADNQIKKHNHPQAFHQIGNTPLFELTSLPVFSLFDKIRVFAKLEMFNYGGSIKDRPALFMIERAEAQGLLEGKSIIEPTSGNTGIGIAWIGRLKNIDVTLVMPESSSKERINYLRSYGARVILTPANKGMDGAIQEARKLASKSSNKYVLLDQFNNNANWEAHFYTTGPEIWKQTNEKVDYFVSGIGTGGTIMGVSRFLKAKNPYLQVLGIEPDVVSVIPGLKNVKVVEEVPGIFNEKEIDQIIQVSDLEATTMAKRLAREQSLLVGPSSGAVLAGIVKWLRRTVDCIEGNIVTIFPDSGSKYFSTMYY